MVLIAIRTLGRGMSVGMDVGRLSFGVATTYGLFDGSLDIAKCLFGLVEKETHLDGFFLECWAVGYWAIFCCCPAWATLRFPELVCSPIAIIQAVVVSKWCDALLADVSRRCYGK